MKETLSNLYDQCCPCETDDLLPERTALTWKIFSATRYGGSWSSMSDDFVVRVGSDSVSNPYSGDTSTSECLPILCVKKTGESQPSWANSIINTHYTKGGARRDSWVQGEVAFTRPVLGRSITSLATANSMCEEELGSGFRMGSHHDGDCPPYTGCGWGFWGSLVKSEQAGMTKRFWVHIKD